MAGGATPRRQDESQYAESGVKFLRIQNVTEHGLDFDDVKFISPATHNELLGRSQLQNGDVLLTITGRIGTAVTVRQADLPANINQHIVLLRVEQSKIAPDFLTVFLNSDLGARLSNRSVTGTTRLALDYGAVRAIPIPLPPLEVQAQLVAELEAARQQRRDDLARADALLGGVDEWLLDQLGLTPSAPDSRSSFAVTLGQIKGERADVSFNSPQSKAMNALYRSVAHQPFGELMLSITKGETPLWRGDAYAQEGVNFLRAQNISSGEIIGELLKIEDAVHERMERSQLSGGELLYTMAGTIGFAARFPHSLAPANINQAIAKIVLKPGLNEDYLLTIINSAAVRNQALQNLTVSSQPNINFDQIKALLIPLPPLALQQTIATEVRQRRAQARALRDEAETAWQSAKARFEAQLLGGKP